VHVVERYRLIDGAFPGSNADFERIVGPVAARTPQQGDGG
jgi:hypothetical protein